ncbi:hypothetical protein AMECASPLE_028291 [Ameca splendens]|uniref:Uncharacterized protein n=1 Tax=Ameca splendens TaxID=208324 RepID=A0ABV0YHP5_9TELE
MIKTRFLCGGGGRVIVRLIRSSPLASAREHPLTPRFALNSVPLFGPGAAGKGSRNSRKTEPELLMISGSPPWSMLGSASLLFNGQKSERSLVGTPGGGRTVQPVQLVSGCWELILRFSSDSDVTLEPNAFSLKEGLLIVLVLTSICSTGVITKYCCLYVLTSEEHVLK